MKSDERPEHRILVVMDMPDVVHSLGNVSSFFVNLRMCSRQFPLLHYAGFVVFEYSALRYPLVPTTNHYETNCNFSVNKIGRNKKSTTI